MSLIFSFSVTFLLHCILPQMFRPSLLSSLFSISFTSTAVAGCHQYRAMESTSAYSVAKFLRGGGTAAASPKAAARAESVDGGGVVKPGMSWLARLTTGRRGPSAPRPAIVDSRAPPDRHENRPTASRSETASRSGPRQSTKGALQAAARCAASIGVQDRTCCTKPGVHCHQHRAMRQPG